MPDKAAMASSRLRIGVGAVRLEFAFDVGQGIDLDAASALLAAPGERPRLRHLRRAPLWFQFEPPPLRLRQEPTEAVADLPGSEPAQIEFTLYDFGAVALAYIVPASGPLRELIRWTAVADELEPDARRRVRELLASIDAAVQAPELGPFCEDYVVLHVAALEPPTAPADLIPGHAAELAAVLRSEAAPLSAQEIDDALAMRISYGPDDVAFVDWQAAIVLDQAAEDSLAVLEFVNVQLLEMRWLDHQLDAALERAYETLSAQRRRAGPGGGGDLFALGRLQVETAVVYERLRNALKLLGDPFLARLYRLSAQRFHLGEWEQSITRKLETIESVYQKLFDRASARRMELLEWIIILLIALSMLTPLWLGK